MGKKYITKYNDLVSYYHYIFVGYLCSLPFYRSKILLTQNNFMKVLLLSLFVIISGTISAQSFFKPLPKIQPSTSVQRNIISKTVITGLDSTYGAFRPIVIAAAYSIPDNHLMAGIGLGYQNITYNYATQRSYCNYSINAVGFAGGAIVPTNLGQVVSYGIMLGALNNTVMAGAALNDGKVNFVLSVGINFNN